VAVLERGAHCSERSELMESTCGGPMRQLGARGQVKWSELTSINGMTKSKNDALKENPDEAGPNKGIDINKPYKQLKRLAFNKRFHKW